MNQKFAGERVPFWEQTFARSQRRVVRQQQFFELRSSPL
jgi:hypothetical protein